MRQAPFSLGPRPISPVLVLAAIPAYEGPRDNLQIVISIAEAIGVDVPTFGKDAWVVTAPLSGLTG